MQSNASRFFKTNMCSGLNVSLLGTSSKNGCQWEVRSIKPCIIAQWTQSNIQNLHNPTQIEMMDDLTQHEDLQWIYHDLPIPSMINPFRFERRHWEMRIQPMEPPGTKIWHIHTLDKKHDQNQTCFSIFYPFKYWIDIFYIFIFHTFIYKITINTYVVGF